MGRVHATSALAGCRLLSPSLQNLHDIQSFAQCRVRRSPLFSSFTACGAPAMLFGALRRCCPPHPIASYPLFHLLPSCNHACAGALYALLSLCMPQLLLLCPNLFSCFPCISFDGAAPCRPPACQTLHHTAAGVTCSTCRWRQCAGSPPPGRRCTRRACCWLNNVWT